MRQQLAHLDVPRRDHRGVVVAIGLSQVAADHLAATSPTSSSPTPRR